MFYWTIENASLKPICEILINELSMLTFRYTILAAHLLTLLWKIIETTMDNTVIFLCQDSSAILYDEQTKKPCRKFLQKGNRMLKWYSYPITRKLYWTPFCYPHFFPWFLFAGICDFGPNCRFSHMSEEDLFNLKRQVEGKLKPKVRALYLVIYTFLNEHHSHPKQYATHIICKFNSTI